MLDNEIMPGPFEKHMENASTIGGKISKV